MKAMLAASTVPDLKTLKYPKMVSPKMDGIRCLMVEGKAMSRNAKPLPNKYLQSMLQGLNYFDGEIMLLNDAGHIKHGVFEEVDSFVMSQDKVRDFAYCVFDSFKNPIIPFKIRTKDAKDSIENNLNQFIRYVDQPYVTNWESALDLSEQYISLGYEGSIIRSLDAPYKFGRSTLNQEWMLKYKKFYDAEGEVIFTNELMRNLDTSSKRLDNMVGAGTLGSLTICWNGKSFKVGSGFNDAQRIEYWKNRKELHGKLVTFKYQELTKYGIPRFPTFKSFRNRIDC